MEVQFSVPAVLGFADGAAGLAHCVISLCFTLAGCCLCPIVGLFLWVSLVA